MSWDKNEFMNLCKLSGLQGVEIYIETLEKKYYCAELHHKLYQEFYKKLHNKIEEGKILEIMKNGRFKTYQWNAEAEAVSCVHITHTMVDVLLQIINKSILNEDIPENRVNFYDIKKRLKQKSASKILEKLKILKKSDEYEYINHLDNKLKHQNLVNTDYVQDNLTNRENMKKGLKFQSFKVKCSNGEAKRFPEVWIEDITDKYRRKIINLVENIGHEINEMLKT